MTKTEEFRRVALPYSLVRCKDGRWLVLNRLYKPVGCTGPVFVDYNTCPGIRLRLTKAQLRRISDSELPSGSLAQVWLYNDANAPRPRTPHRAAYAERLMALVDADAFRD
jgi:hypothetical protein